MLVTLHRAPGDVGSTPLADGFARAFLATCEWAQNDDETKDAKC